MTDMYERLVDERDPSPSQGTSGTLYRYMAADGLLHTVRTKHLRMNAWSQMNDPRESKEWVASGALRAVGAYSEQEMRERVDVVMRRSARLMALTMDRSCRDEGSRSHLFHRGWASASMWSQYANAHEGVCLVLDRDSLLENAMNVPPADGRYTTWGEVQYEDVPRVFELRGNFATQAEFDEELDRFLGARRQISALHMVKSRDWAHEAEFRILTIDVKAAPEELDTPLSVPVGDALLGVIFGYKHPFPELVAAGMRESMGPSAPELFVCDWEGGAPRLRPLRQ